MKPDLIVSWPRHMDYPLWRQVIHEERGRFAKVIVVLTNMNVNKDYSNFIKKAMRVDGITFFMISPAEAEEDWRDMAIKGALKESNAPWIFFTEQDFFWNTGFWECVSEQESKYGYIVGMVGERVHPCCIFLKRNVLNKTSKDFGVIRDVSDHFSRIQNDLANEPRFEIPQDLWFHFGGLSQNMFLLMNGSKELYLPQDFANYVKACQKVTVPMHDDFLKVFNSYEVL